MHGGIALLAVVTAYGALMSGDAAGAGESLTLSLHGAVGQSPGGTGGADEAALRSASRVPALR